MVVTTKTGDDGKSRWMGKTVDKDSPLLEAVGELDELQAVIGIVETSLRGPRSGGGRSNLVEDRQATITMRGLQTDLYGIMGELAYGKRISNFPPRGLPKGRKFQISNLEEKIKKLEKELGEINKFLIFKNKKAVKLNWARTVCRRVERRLVTLKNVQEIDLDILIYINRLSDYLFVIARQAEEISRNKKLKKV